MKKIAVFKDLSKTGYMDAVVFQETREGFEKWFFDKDGYNKHFLYKTKESFYNAIERCLKNTKRFDLEYSRYFLP